jgi:hypothetical protein
MSSYASTGRWSHGSIRPGDRGNSSSYRELGTGGVREWAIFTSTFLTVTVSKAWISRPKTSVI